MRVSLLDYTGAGFDDPWYAAELMIFTKNTRIKMSPDGLKDIAGWSEEKKLGELNYMANTIRSSWEFVDYTFLLEDVTRAFTHQLVRTRHASYAQQTMQILRVDATNVKMPPRFAEVEYLHGRWDGIVGEVADAYDDMLKAGATVEEARGILPTNILTNIVVKLNLRTASEIFSSRVSPRNLGEYADVARTMRELIIEVHPWAAIFLEQDVYKVLEDMDRKLLMLRDGKVPPVKVPEIATLLLKGVDQIRREK
jgi:thymidylate synthase ThyX